MSKDQPVFPRNEQSWEKRPDGLPGPYPWGKIEPGLTKRELGAFLIAQGLFAGCPWSDPEDFKDDKSVPEALDMVADISVKAAEAILRRLER